MCINTRPLPSPLSFLKGSVAVCRKPFSLGGTIQTGELVLDTPAFDPEQLPNVAGFLIALKYNDILPGHGVKWLRGVLYPVYLTTGEIIHLCILESRLHFAVTREG